MAGFISSTGVAASNDEGEILMVKEGKEHVHGRWDFPGGGLEHSEDFADCAVREVKEETGYEVEIIGFYGVYIEESDTTDVPVISVLFEAEITGKGEPDHHFEGEILDHRFFTIEEIKDLELRKENRTEMLEIIEENEPLPIERLKDLRSS